MAKKPLKKPVPKPEPEAKPEPKAKTIACSGCGVEQDSKLQRCPTCGQGF